MDGKTSEEKEENSCKNFEVKSRSFSILQCKIILSFIFKYSYILNYMFYLFICLLFLLAMFIFSLFFITLLYV